VLLLRVASGDTDYAGRFGEEVNAGFGKCRRLMAVNWRYHVKNVKFVWPTQKDAAQAKVRETLRGPDALSGMELIVGVTALALVLGFGAGYAAHKRKSRMRRSYYHRD
jgi:hypothetical protein